MTTPRWSLPVDLADPDDVRAKVSDAERIVREIETELQRMRSIAKMLRGMASAADTADAIESGRDLVALGALSAPAESSPDGGHGTDDSREGAGRAQLQDRVIGAINAIDRPIRSRDLRDLLVAEGHDLSADSVSNALWYAADRGLIKKVGRGVYAPLSYEPRTEDDDAPSPSVSGWATAAPVVAVHGYDVLNAVRQTFVR